MKLELKQMNTAQAGEIRILRCLRRAGISGWYSSPTADARLAVIANSEHIQAMVDLREWYHALPEVAQGVPADAFSDGELADLFIQYTREEGLPAPVLTETPFFYSHSAGDTPAVNRTWLTFRTPGGLLWLRHLPGAVVRRCARTDELWSGIPFRVEFRMGESRLSASLLKQINTGDVLLITHPCNHFLVEGQPVGKFSQHEEAFQVTEFIHEEQGISAETVNQAEKDEMAVAQSGGMSRQVCRSLPVHLTFIAGERTLTAGELSSTCVGDVIAVTSSGLAGVRIRANGLYIGDGQLISIEGQPGVEITYLLPGVTDGE